MCAFPRFDLSETSYALPLMADQTPAWREVYTEIADQLVGRYTTFWAAIDWLISNLGIDFSPCWRLISHQWQGIGGFGKIKTRKRAHRSGACAVPPGERITSRAPVILGGSFVPNKTQPTPCSLIKF
jgi:hypothetical protein